MGHCHRRPWLFIWLAAACAASTTPAKVDVRPGRAAPYRLAAEDVVEVSVWKEPGLSVTAPVRPDGRITVPGAGELLAVGRTARELARVIEARLSKTLAAPTVSVIVKEVNGARIYVLGEVGRPGAYPIRGTLSVLQVLALAGGLTEFADRDEIVVLRDAGDGRQVRIAFDYGAAVRGQVVPRLEPGDTIVVP